MPYLLNLVYLLAIGLASPWLVYRAMRTGKYRRGWEAKFLGNVPRRSGSQPCIWLHAVSVGEVNLLDTLIKRLRAKHPDWEIVISTTTDTGFRLAQKKYSAYTVFYCPLDFSWAVQRAMKRIRPELLVLAELELWPNLIRYATRQGCKVAVVNARLSTKSFQGYRRIRWLVGPLFQALDLIAAQTETYADRFQQLGAPQNRVTVTGSLKFDGAQLDRNNPQTARLAQVAGFRSHDKVLLIGSSQDPEEQIALDVFAKLKDTYPDLRLVLVPRHPERFDQVARMLEQSGLDWQRRTELSADRPPQASSRILLVDTVGELAAWWGTCQIAYVGGSMGRRGGQNMIEPSAYGAAVSFGPRTENFRDVVQLLLANDAAQVIHHAEQLEQFVRRCLQEPGFRKQLGENARRLVQAQTGATDLTTSLIENLLHTNVGMGGEKTRAA